MGTVFEYAGTLPKKEIERKMKELSEKIKYTFRDISWLEKAFYTAVNTTTNKEKYANSPMATLGDRVLSFMIAENLFDSGKTSGEITIDKAEEENNSRWFGYSEKMELYRFAFNNTYFFDDAPQNEQLPHSQHDRYFEALVAAIYKDTACFEKTRNIMTEIFKVLNQNE